MISENKKTSLLVTEQLPDFVKENPDYANFSLFLQAYYEWMEQSGQMLEGSKNLLSYADVDTTSNNFLTYFTNEFLPNFPAESLIDKRQAVKIAKQLYQTKGTPASYQFLFKILFDSQFEYFYTQDAVLKASDGIWYVAKSLKLNSSDDAFLGLNDAVNGSYRLFGETTKSIATVETAVISGEKIEVFISNIERLFQSGEFVRVVDSYNQDVYFLNGVAVQKNENGDYPTGATTLRAKIVGQISQIRINPRFRGLSYKVGDPVIVYGGLSSNNGIGATAEVGATTRGSIQSVQVVEGGYGFRASPNTVINVQGDGSGANLVVGSLDPTASKTAQVTRVANNVISIGQNVTIGNATYSFFAANTQANANTPLINAFSFIAFTTYPLSSVLVENGGGGFSTVPTVTATSNYKTYLDTDADLAKLGILAPIQIKDRGHGYQVNDKIILTGGTGAGAFANVKTVNAIGAITSVEYVYDPNLLYPLGGLGYRAGSGLPGLAIQSANNQANGASLYIPGVLGDGESLLPIVDRAGSVTTIKLLTTGEDYVEVPNVSLRVQDIVVSNVFVGNTPQKDDVIYQGTDINVASYRATVNSISILQPFNDPANTLYNIRVFNYTASPNTQLPLKIDRNINLTMANTQFNSNYNRYGVRTYGDGSARANATFLNGLALSQGQYINSQGQPSSFSILQSKDYNNYTYQITVEKEIAKYRDILINLLHPAGMKVIGRMVDKNLANFDYHAQRATYSARPLYAANGGIGGTGATATIATDFTNKSNNIIKFNNILGANLANIIFANSTILKLENSKGSNVSGLVLAVDSVNDTVKIDANVWLTFSNVASVTANAGSNTINITKVYTAVYNVINNGTYTDVFYPLKDILFAGDKVLIANNTQKTVNYVDYEDNVVYLTENLTSDANSYMSVNRTFVSESNYVLDQITLIGPVGTTYIPELVTQDGRNIITQDGKIILLG